MPQAPDRGALEREFLELKSFVHTIMNVAAEVPEEEAIERFAALDQLESKALKQSLKGMRMALSDCLESCTHWSVARIRHLDAMLRRNSILTISEARLLHSKKLGAVMRRGSIRTTVEFYMVQGVLADASSSLTLYDRQLLEAAANAFSSGAA